MFFFLTDQRFWLCNRFVEILLYIYYINSTGYTQKCHASTSIKSWRITWKKNQTFHRKEEINAGNWLAGTLRNDNNNISKKVNNCGRATLVLHVMHILIVINKRVITGIIIIIADIVVQARVENTFFLP